MKRPAYVQWNNLVLLYVNVDKLHNITDILVSRGIAAVAPQSQISLPSLWYESHCFRLPASVFCPLFWNHRANRPVKLMSLFMGCCLGDSRGGWGCGVSLSGDTARLNKLRTHTHTHTHTHISGDNGWSLYFAAWWRSSLAYIWFSLLSLPRRNYK